MFEGLGSAITTAAAGRGRERGEEQRCEKGNQNDLLVACASYSSNVGLDVSSVLCLYGDYDARVRVYLHHQRSLNRELMLSSGL